MYIAEYFARRGKSVLLCEKEENFMQRASFANQARVHNGYHYPRSILTALRSHISFARFCEEFHGCIVSSFEKYYMVGRLLGKVTARQFEEFCHRIGVHCEPATQKVLRLVNPNLIEAVFSAEECAFNSVKLKNTMQARLDDAGVEYLLNTEVRLIKQKRHGLEAEIHPVEGKVEASETVAADQVFNCTYSMLNYVLTESGIEPIPLKHEMTEMCLVEVANELKNMGITVMCGPFFSIMPFPPRRGLHIFSHVRYTPHYEWHDVLNESYINAHEHFKKVEKKSAWKPMQLDSQRYIPILADCKYMGSIWEVKTTLPRSESDDSRPILFKPNYGFKGFHSVMGGKIDNVYDVIEEIEKLGLTG